MLDFCLYLLYRAGSGIIGLVPLHLLFRLGELLGLALWIFSRNYRRLVAA